MRHYYCFLLVFLCVSCNEQYNCEEPMNEYKDSCKQTEAILAKAVHGVPLIIPLYSSSPTLFLIPVSDDKETLEVDRLYLLEYDNTRDFENNLYKIDEIVRIVDDDTRNVAVVTDIMDGTQNKIEIDNFIMHKIRKLNKDRFEYKSNIIIPIRYDSIR